EFKGEIKDISKVDFTKDGTYTVKVKGQLSLHGVSNEVEAEGKIKVQGGKISAQTEFSVKLSDYKVSVPGLVADKVAKVAKINVTCSLEILKS
ncbi:MAG: YceI family protein, partial [Chitinophagaceae bacterium]|nr:YceI family protein [Chitinophagaceae bacterium]